MHLAEGILPLSQAAVWTAVAVPAVAWSLRGEQQARHKSASSSVMMSGVTSLLFAVTLLPLPVPVVGATSHICLSPVLALIVGVRRMIWPVFFILLMQAVFFAHGGLTTLGVNTLALGLFGPLITVCLWGLIRKADAGNALTLGIACGVGGLGVYVVDALVLAFALSSEVAPMTTFITVLIGFAPVQVPLAVVEAFISVGLIRQLAVRRPDLLPVGLRERFKPSSSMTTVSLIVLVMNVTGCDYEAIDETVFSATSDAAGRTPGDSLLDLSTGEFGLAMTVILLFGLGFIAGRSWENLFRGDDDAFPR